MSIEKGRISRRQATFLVSNTILASVVLISPALLAKETGQDAWIAVIIAGIGGVLIGNLIVSLGLRYPNKNLVEYSMDLLGPWLGRLIGVLLGLFFLYLNGYVIRSFGALLVASVMPETPLVIFSILIVVLASYGVYLGLEVFARVNEIVFPISVLLSLVIVAMALPEMDFNQLLPVFEHSFPHMLRGTVILTTFYAEGAFFSMVIPYLRRPREARPVVYEVNIWLAVAMIANIVGVIALFGPEETGRMIFPSFELAKTVHLSIFLERIDSLVVGIWVATVGLKVTVLYYVSVLTFAQSFNLQTYRPLVLPTAFILAALSILEFSDTIQVRIFLSRFLPPFTITVLFGIPLVLFLIALIRKKGVAGGEKKNEDETSQT